jgi:hypothetical protein
MRLHPTERLPLSLHDTISTCESLSSAAAGLSEVAFVVPRGWQDVRVKSSGSLWFGYGVVLVVTFLVGLLAFTVWVLSKVF